jgi:hypothetical protein
MPGTGISRHGSLDAPAAHCATRDVEYHFGPDEFAVETYAFDHGDLRVGVHLHPVFSDPDAFEQHAETDPVLAWIYVRRKGTPAIVHKLNAQYDGMMGFFLNLDHGWGGRSIPGSKRTSLWTREELNTAVVSFLDQGQPG